MRNGAGALMDFGCYGANLMTYLMQGARPTSVTAVTQQLQPSDYPRVDDEATIVVTYPSAQAIIQASWNWPIGRKDLEIYGTRGYVMTDNRSVDAHARLRVGDGERGVAARARRHRTTIPSPTSRRCRAEGRCLASAIRRRWRTT